MAIAINPQTPRELLERLIGSQTVHVAEAAKMHISCGNKNDGWKPIFQKKKSILLFEERESLKAALDKFKVKQKLYWTQDFPEWIEGREREEREKKKSEESQFPFCGACILFIIALLILLIAYLTTGLRVLIATINLLLVSTKEIIEVFVLKFIRKKENIRQPCSFKGRLERLVQRAKKGLNNASEPIKFIYIGRLKKAARHPEITADAMKQLLLLKRHDICEVAISNPKIIQFIAEEWDLETLNLFENYYLRLIAKRPDTPASVLEKLVQHEVWTVRDVALRHPNADRQVIEQWQKSSVYSDQELESLLRDEDEWFEEWLELPVVARLTILTHREVPIGILAQAFRSDWWLERCAIAQNPSTPRSIRQRLAEDGNWAVRAAARETL